MQEAWAAWEREFPLRFLLVRETEDDDPGADGGLDLWAKVAGVEGLFLDKPAVPREVLTLRGCAVAGALRAALDSAGAAPTLYGQICVQVSDQSGPEQWWSLFDTTIIAHCPNTEDPSLLDIVIGAGIEGQEEHCWSEPLAGLARFDLFNDDDEVPIATCRRIDGLYRPRAPRLRPLTLVGCELTQFGRTLNPPRTFTELWALDRTGQVMYKLNVDPEIEQMSPSILGAALVDITLADCYFPLRTVARPVWEAWYDRGRTEPNQWTHFTPEQKEYWSVLAFHADSRTALPSGGTYHLDGSHIVDVPSLYCALGEALLGAGGYFGGVGFFGNLLGGLDDQLRSGFGITPPFTLIWNNSEIARQALAEVIESPSQELGYFDEVVRVLRNRGVTVRLR